jgi:hypothetical protein
VYKSTEPPFLSKRLIRRHIAMQPDRPMP